MALRRGRKTVSNWAECGRINELDTHRFAQHHNGTCFNLFLQASFIIAKAPKNSASLALEIPTLPRSGLFKHMLGLFCRQRYFGGAAEFLRNFAFI